MEPSRPVAADQQASPHDHEVPLRIGAIQLHPARLTYGMITLVALLALLAQNTHISAPKALGVTFGASLALWLAHCFSEAVGAHYMVRRRLRRVEMRKILIQELSVVVGVILPVGLLICATFEWIETQTALRMAAWAGVGILSLSGWAVAEAGGLSFVSRFMTAAAYGALGTAIVILELAFTH